ESSSVPKCYECNQPGHLRVDCPSFKKRMERSERKTFNDKKAKKAYITWEDNDMDSSKDSENEVVNLNLMAKNYESNEVVTSSNNNLSISFDELQYAFTNLHKESIILAKLVSFSRKTISNLENEVLKLNEELENLRTKVKTLKPIDTNQSSTIKVIHDSKEASNSCNCCSKFIEEIKDLKNSVAKFIIGKNNLDIILGKQRCVFDKTELRYRPDKQQKLYKNFFVSTQKNSSPFLTCFYCGKKRHSAS
ncbi:hypothetical protein glysoja_043633, partial [Glycine soja]